jgi:hypothetical protein
MSTTWPVPLFVFTMKKGKRCKMAIDLEGGLGLFLLKSGALVGRFLLRGTQPLVVEEGYTYRSYLFNTSLYRFQPFLQFRADDISKGNVIINSATRSLHLAPDPQVRQPIISHSFADLGLENEDGDLTIFTSRKPL